MLSSLIDPEKSIDKDLQAFKIDTVEMMSPPVKLNSAFEDAVANVKILERVD